MPYTGSSAATTLAVCGQRTQAADEQRMRECGAHDPEHDGEQDRARIRNHRRECN